MSSELLYRRVRQSETGLLTKLCASENVFSKYYKSHAEWQEKAVKDIGSNERVVFGAFKFTIGNYRPRLDLTACIFLKYSIYQKSMEFKNLILSNDEHEASTLIDKAIRFCEVRNIVDKIEIEIPQEEHKIIALFLQKNFKIVSIRERYEAPSVYVCILERTEGTNYYGDPFDFTKLGVWLLKKFVPCENLQIDEGSEFDNISFEIKNGAYSKLPKEKKLHGILWIIEDEEDIRLDYFLKPKENLIRVNMVLASCQLSEKSKKALVKKDIVFFDKEELLKYSGGGESSLNIPFTKDDVGGFITVLEHTEVENYLKRGNTLTYYLFGIGDTCLIKGKEHEDDESNLEYTLAIYCPDCDEGILGFYTFSNFKTYRFESLLAKYKNDGYPENTALSPEDLEFYCTFSKDELVTVADCTDFYKFNKPLGLGGAGGWESSNQVAEYILNQVNSGNNSFYLDSESCKKLVQIANKQKSEMVEVFLSVLDVLANIGTITTSVQQQITKTEKLLKEDKGFDERWEGMNNNSIFKDLMEGLMDDLKIHVKKLSAISASSTLDTEEKIKHRKITAAKALYVLKELEPQKNNISFYKELFDVLTKISQMES